MTNPRMHPRIAPLEAPYEPAIAAAFDRVMPPGVAPLKLFRTMAANPRVLQRLFAGNLLDAGSISLRERELLILRTCQRCGAEYEWGVHAALFARTAGLEAGELALLASGGEGTTLLAPRELALLTAVDELHTHATLSDAAWGALAEYYSAEQILEVIALVGYYHTISFIANATGVELEPFAPRMAAMAAG
jgi:alkylhydroperoxidase family enzyme